MRLFYLLLLTFIITPFHVQASNWVGCEVKAKIIYNTEGSYTIKLLRVIDQNSGFGTCPLHTDQQLENVKIEGNPSLKLNTIVELTYMKGGSMTPRGAISYESWKVKRSE